MSALAAEVKASMPAIDSVVERVVSGVTSVLEERAIGVAAVTPHGMEETMTRLLHESGLISLVESVRNGSFPRALMQGLFIF